MNVAVKVVGIKSSSLVDAASPGDVVVILVPSGRGRNGVEYAEKRGRCVMKFPGSHLVLNMGGAHGRPAVANDDNIVRVVAKKAKAEAMPGGGLIAARG